MNQLGYGLKRVAKTKLIKEIPETGAIFKEVNRINQQVDDDPTTRRISIDAKIGIKLREFDRLSGSITITGYDITSRVLFKMVVLDLEKQEKV